MINDTLVISFKSKPSFVAIDNATTSTLCQEAGSLIDVPNSQCWSAVQKHTITNNILCQKQ